ncbi:glycosyl hydrolase catalytic core-domain-containing protein [Mycena albidolilacea]|uniref:Glycosyl hydrolase catalytic core-domain-containing protein n=1 Tax=Mycena albidolilacea TaxID=1033008 RepID=A0AAD7F364_9AGAR|nr:glycosyl hydrolase catalytic core-domain-containing protein [Mycena albidolilacea]
MFFRLSVVSTSLAFVLSAAAASSKGSASSAAPASSKAEVSSAAPASTTAAPSSQAPASTAAPASTTAVASVDPTTGKMPKRGLAFAADNSTDVFKANSTGSVASWVYNWGLIPPTYIADSGIEYIPMQWGAADIEKLAVTVKGLGAKTILAFNEPDFAEQSNMNATYAAQLWMQYIEPLKADGIRLGGPAVSSGATGRPWLDEFMSACSQCTIDFIPLHWYGEGTGGFYDYIYQIHGQYPNHTLWITEYASTTANDSVVLDFMNTTIAALDTLDFVERYAWFGFFRPKDGSHYNLLDVNGNLNAAGQVYVDNAKKVVNALPNPTGTGSGAGGPATNSAGGYTTVYPASDTGLTPAFATATGNSAVRVRLGGNEIGRICGVGAAMFFAAVFGAGLVW